MGTCHSSPREPHGFCSAGSRLKINDHTTLITNRKIEAPKKNDEIEENRFRNCNDVS